MDCHLLIVAFRLQLVDKGLYLLHAVLRHDEHGILGGDDDQILRADDRGQNIARVNEAALGFQRNALTFDGVFGIILACHFPDSIPAADIRPAEMAAHNGNGLGLFNHRIVDGVLRRSFEAVAIQTQKADVFAGQIDGGRDGSQNLRRVGGQFGNHHVGAEQEVAGIPQIAFLQITDGGRRIGLFHKGLDHAQVGIVRNHLARIDIAVGRSWFVRHEAEDDDIALLRCFPPQTNRLGKAVFIQNHMVGCQRQNETTGGAAFGNHGRGSHGGGAIAAGRFQNDLNRRTNVFGLTLGEEAEIIVGDDQRVGIERRLGNALQRLLIGGVRANQGLELLRQLVTRNGPKA